MTDLATQVALLQRDVEGLKAEVQQLEERERAMLLRGITILGAAVTALGALAWSAISEKMGGVK